MILGVSGLMPDPNPPVGSLRCLCSAVWGGFCWDVCCDPGPLGIQGCGCSSSCSCPSPGHRGAAAPGPVISALILHPFPTALTSANPPLALCQAWVVSNICSSLLPVKNQFYQCWRTWTVFKRPSDCVDQQPCCHQVCSWPVWDRWKPNQCLAAFPGVCCSCVRKEMAL